jgi:DNA-binding transcriptional ArsR family regulator
MVWDINFPTQSQKLLMLKLADYASDDGGSVFPSNETLGEYASCDERTVQRALKAFRGVGILHLMREGGTGPKSTNHWQINVPLLRVLLNGSVKIVGNGSELTIEGDLGALPEGDNLSGFKGDIKGDIKGDNLSSRVTFDPLRVTRVSSKGDTGVTQSTNNHHIDPSCAHERAGEGGARAPSAKKQLVALEVTARDSQWDAWMQWLRAANRYDLEEAALHHRKLIAFGSRFPSSTRSSPRNCPP